MATPTQQQMCEHFIPILKDKGVRITKKGLRLARPARPGEEVLTIVNGEVLTRIRADVPGSMIIRQESADHEFYLLDPEKFAKNYHTEGIDITEAGPSFDQLRHRNFKYYRRKGELLLYQVGQKDMDFVPSGRFEVVFSSTPVSLKAGDFLVTSYPELSEIWVSKHSVIYEDEGQHPLGVRSQEEMCRHFLPIMREKGRVVEKKGQRLARRAVRGEEVPTIVNGEIMSRSRVADDSSMVVRQESADHELYVLSQDKFQRNYKRLEGDVEEVDALGSLKERGFKPYWRTGKVRVYEVTHEDMEFLPAQKFFGTFSPFPLAVRPGFLLVTNEPECNEVWVSRNAAIYSDEGQLIQGLGVRTQAEMLEHFLPLMRHRGLRMRRAGRRLARAARRGEEVLTIVNGEVVARTTVLDDTSMVVQEESVDREVYVVDGETFAQNYRQPSMEVPRKGPEFDELRKRGFRIYEKTAGMFLVYKVTEEDMKFVPKGKFQVPFSVIPQPLRAGDYLVTRLPEKKVVFCSRNAEQIFLSRENFEVHFAFASPLMYPALSIGGELEGLRSSGAAVRLTCATRENLQSLKRAWVSRTPTVLHISCHTIQVRSKVNALVENSRAFNAVSPQDLATWVIGGGPAPQLLVLLSCYSEAVAKTCLEHGVRRAVAVRAAKSLLDSAARDFTTTFYAELRTQCNVERAFRITLESMRASREPGVASEASKLVLLPEAQEEFELGGQALTYGLRAEEPTEIEPGIAVRMPFGAGEANSVEALASPLLERLGELPVPASRGQFITQTLAALWRLRFLKVSSEWPGDLQDFAAVAQRFAAFPGGRPFSGGVIAVALSEATFSNILSQQQMCEIFLPRMKLRGQVVPKVGRRLARLAVRGEEVQTVINGETVAKTIVDDDTSYVIQQDSVDRELYVLSAEKFERNYELPGTELVEQGTAYDSLRARGFRYYERKGHVRIYKVTDQDMLDVPGGKFQVDFSTTPQPVRAGDYLATGYPEATEVFLSRNAEQIYLSQIIRSQDEMCRHFLPILRKCGIVVRRKGWRLARPAMRGEEVLTIVDGEEISKALVDDDSSMVIMAETTDREWYVLGSDSFRASYECPGIDIKDDSPDSTVLRDRGFKYYKRHGMARMYQVSDSDLDFLPSRKFFCKGTTFPLLLRAGDYLVTGYPDSSEIYLSRHGEEVFEHVSHRELIRSQEEMCERFRPVLLQRGVRVPRSGYTLARPAKDGEVIRTLIDGEMVAKVEATSGSMVLRLDTTDRELQVLTESEFQEDHCLPAELWEDSSPEVQVLQKRGYKRYRQKGTALLYQVTQEDMEDFVPGGRFQIPGGLIPSTLRAGDYLEARHPSPRWVRMNRNAGQVYRTDLRRASVAAEDTVPPREPQSLLASSMLPSRLMQFRSQSSQLGSQSTQFMEPEGHPRLEVRTPVTIDRAYSAPNSSRPEGLVEEQGLGSSSERTSFVKRLRSEISGLQETRVLGALEEGLRAAAKQQASLARRWYDDGAAIEGQGERPASALLHRGLAVAEASEAELAVASWLNCLPRGVRGLLVLTDAAEALTHEAPRRLLERLLNRHRGLHLLVTLTKKPGEELPHFPAFRNVEQYDVVSLPAIDEREAAEAFVSQLVRRGQDRLLGPLSQEEALKRLQGEKILRGCDQLTKVLQKVDEVTVADQPLFSQDSSELSMRTTPLR